MNKNKPLIFLVEDDLDDQYMFKMVLKELSIDVDVVPFENGLVAYQALSRLCVSDAASDGEYEQVLAQESLPDIILLDLNLPVWDGKKTLAILKKDQRLKSIPIVIYSTSKSEHDIADCYDLGANSFISKAAEYELLQQQIKSICTYWFYTVLL